MGEPVNIYDLAKTMALFAGRTPDKDLPIEFTGLIEGEKITEELWEDWERPEPTESEGISVIHAENPLARGILHHVGAMERYVKRGDRDGLLAYLRHVVPGFKQKPDVASHMPPPTLAVAPISLGAA
jgi:FlaA1/EpsC-like NDP-sugar epimerase